MDPKQIVRRGEAYDFWIADDWSSSSDQKKSGMRQVRAIDVTYANGDRATMVLDGNGQPISSIRDLSPDENQQRIWKDQQAAANRPPDERNNNGRRERWNPQTSKWDDVGPAVDTSATPRNSQTSEQVEGTPTPNGPDNERPRMVTRDASGKEISSRPLTPAEEKQWRENRERSRNPGGKTDADIAAEKKEADAKAERDAQQNRGTTTLKPDGKGGTIAVTTYPDGRAPTTAPVPGVPSETASKYSEVKQDQTTGKWHGLTKDGQWEEIAGGPSGPPDKTAFGAEPEGAPPLDLTADNRRLVAGLKAYSDWLSQQVKLHKDTGGAQGIPAAEATKLMERRIALAEPLMRTNTETINTQASQRGQDITQRGQSIGEVQNRRSMAQAVAADVNRRGDERLKFLRPENAADHIAARQEEMQNAIAYARQWGGMQDVPEVGAPGFPALAQARQQALSGIQTAAQGGPRIFAERAPGPPPPMTRDAAMANPAFRPAPAVEGSETPVASAGPMVPVAVNPVDASPIVLPTQLPGNTARFMQEARYGAGTYFDPEAAGAGLSMELGIDPEIMKQAISGLYG